MAQFRKPRARIDRDAYTRLRWQVLERDGWRCQVCGCMSNLQVHHMTPRSLSGDDTSSNLMTLCDVCHRTVHDQKTSI